MPFLDDSQTCHKDVFLGLKFFFYPHNIPNKCLKASTLLIKWFVIIKHCWSFCHFCHKTFLRYKSHAAILLLPSNTNCCPHTTDLYNKTQVFDIKKNAMEINVEFMFDVQILFWLFVSTNMIT